MSEWAHQQAIAPQAQARSITFEEGAQIACAEEKVSFLFSWCFIFVILPSFAESPIYSGTNTRETVPRLLDAWRERSLRGSEAFEGKQEH